MMRKLLLLLVFVTALLPLLWTLLAAFGVRPINTHTPPTWTLPPTLDYFTTIQSEQTFIWREFATSIILSSVTTLLTISVTFLAAYGLARATFRYKQWVLQMFLILASLPVMSYVLPLSDLLRLLRLHDTFVGLTLSESAFLIPLSVYILHGYIAALPVELEDAARLDGAGLAALLWRVTLPNIAQGLIALAVIIFVLSWNQFFLPLVLTTGTQIRTLPVMIRSFFILERDFDWSQAAAVLTLSLLPVAVVVAAAQQALEHFRLQTNTQ